MANILSIKNLNFSYKKNIIFKNFNLEVEEKKFISIVGNNTSGKTTLIKLIAGVLPSNNSITIGYSYINDKRFHDHSKELGITYGNKLDSFLFDDVYKEMAFPLENLNIEPKEIEKRIIDLSKFFEITKLLDKKTYDLTNSEKQQLLIVIALLHNPKLLLLDNPFSMMNLSLKNKVIDKLIKYQKENDLTILLTTINLEDTIKTDYVYVINSGNIVVEGKPLTVMQEDRILNKLGLNLPFTIDLSLKLVFYDLLDEIEVDINRMVDILWK